MAPVGTICTAAAVAGTIRTAAGVAGTIRTAVGAVGGQLRNAVGEGLVLSLLLCERQGTGVRRQGDGSQTASQSSLVQHRAGTPSTAHLVHKDRAQTHHEESRTRQTNGKGSGQLDTRQDFTLIYFSFMVRLKLRSGQWSLRRKKYVAYCTQMSYYCKQSCEGMRKTACLLHCQTERTTNGAYDAKPRL